VLVCRTSDHATAVSSLLRSSKLESANSSTFHWFARALTPIQGRCQVGGPESGPPASARGTCANRVNMVSFSSELGGGRVLLRTTDIAVVKDENRASNNIFSVTCYNVTL